MLKINDIKTVVASRKMEFHFGDGKTETFLVRVGKPYKYGDGLDWCCPYEIGDASNRRLRGAFGADSLEALELALMMIKVETETRERFRIDQTDPTI